jgi:hypothetical protein
MVVVKMLLMVVVILLVMEVEPLVVEVEEEVHTILLFQQSHQWPLLFQVLLQT